MHCASYSFKLALSDSYAMQLIQNTIGTIREIYNFIRLSLVSSQIFDNLARKTSKKE